MEMMSFSPLDKKSHRTGRSLLPPKEEWLPVLLPAIRGRGKKGAQGTLYCPPYKYGRDNGSIKGPHERPAWVEVQQKAQREPRKAPTSSASRPPHNPVLCWWLGNHRERGERRKRKWGDLGNERSRPSAGWKPAWRSQVCAHPSPLNSLATGPGPGRNLGKAGGGDPAEVCVRGTKSPL